MNSVRLRARRHRVRPNLHEYFIGSAWAFLWSSVGAPRGAPLPLSLMYQWSIGWWRLEARARARDPIHHGTRALVTDRGVTGSPDKTGVSYRSGFQGRRGSKLRKNPNRNVVKRAHNNLERFQQGWQIQEVWFYGWDAGRKEEIGRVGIRWLGQTGKHLMGQHLSGPRTYIIIVQQYNSTWGIIVMLFEFFSPQYNNSSINVWTSMLFHPHQPKLLVYLKLLFVNMLYEHEKPLCTISTSIASNEGSFFLYKTYNEEYHDLSNHCQFSIYNFF